MKIGIIGLGNMGGAIARKIIADGDTVTVWDINRTAVDEISQKGARAAADPKDVARQSEIVLLILPGPTQVRQTLTDEAGLFEGAHENLIIVDLSTVDPVSTKENYALAKTRNIGYLDSPILGRPQGCGNWTLPVGGDSRIFERAKPVLDKIARKVIHLGPSGTGNVLKLLNNMMFGAINSVTAEVMAASAKLGLDPKLFFDTIADSGAATVSNLFKDLGPKICSRDFSPVFSVDLLHKDMKLGIEMLKNAGIPTVVSTANQLVNEFARAKNLGNYDSSSVVKVYEMFTQGES